MRLSKASIAAIFSFFCLGACAPSLRTSLLSDVDAFHFDRAMERYEALRTEDGPDEELLAIVSLAFLKNEVLRESTELRDEALRALIAGGTSGSETLREIVLVTEHEHVRVHALRALAARGDLDAQHTIESEGLALNAAEPPEPPTIEQANARLTTLLALPFTHETGAEMASLINRLPDGFSTRLQAENTIAQKIEDPLFEVRGFALSAVMSLVNKTPVRFALLRRVAVETELPLFLNVVALVIDDARAREEAAPRLAAMLELRGVHAVEAMRLLHELGDPRALPRLEVLLRDEVSATRRAAAYVLARDLGDPDRARSALTDSDEHVRVHAAQAMLAHASRRSL